MAYYKKKRALIGGDHVSVSARGKRAVANKGSNTKVIAKRGKRVAVNKKNRVVTTTGANPLEKYYGDGDKSAKKVIRRRGRKTSVLKKVRGMK